MPVDVSIAMSRFVPMGHRWQIYNLTVADPAFGDDMIGKLLHFFPGPL